MNFILINKDNGLSFESHFTKIFAGKFHGAESSQSHGQKKTFCDIVHSSCLIELKSNRNDYKETTKETFRRICQNGLDSKSETNIQKGLFYQIINMSRNLGNSMVVVGDYRITPKKLNKLWNTDPKKAFEAYQNYKILIQWPFGSCYTQLKAEKFWSLADKHGPSGLISFQRELEQIAKSNQTQGPEHSVYFSDNHNCVLHHLNLNLSVDDKNLLDQQCNHNFTPLVEESCEVYDFDVSSCISKDDLLIIKDMAIKNHCYSDISIALNRHHTYLRKIANAAFSPDQGYQGKEWDKFRLWLKSLKPLDSNASEIKAFSNTKENLTIKINDLSNQLVELQNENSELKAKLNSPETKQVDETTTLQLEAYQAEIEKLQTQLRELTDYANQLAQGNMEKKTKLDSSQRLYNILKESSARMKRTLDDQKLEIEQLKASGSTIRDQQIIDSLLLLIEKLK
jgi:hypothetical protein